MDNQGSAHDFPHVRFTHFASAVLTCDLQLGNGDTSLVQALGTTIFALTLSL